MYKFKNVLITGASSGLGKNMAIHMQKTVQELLIYHEIMKKCFIK